MRLHDRRQHVVGRNYPVGRIGADPHRRPERPVGQRLHARARRIGAPELLQSLGIEDERHRPDPIPRPRLRVSQRARAESMDNLRASLVHQPLRYPPRAPSEVWVGGYAIEDRRPAPPRERKRDVRHEPRLESSVPQGIVQARQRDSVLSLYLLGRRRRHQCHPDAAPHEVPRHVGDMPFQAPDAVPGRDRPCQHDDPQPFGVHGRSPAVGADAIKQRRIQRLMLLRDHVGIEDRVHAAPRRGAQPRRQRRIALQPPRVRAQLVRRPRQQSRLLVHDHVADPSGPHRDDRTPQRARLDQHASERFRPDRREDQHRGVTHPPKQLRPLQPAEEPDIPAGRPRARLHLRTRGTIARHHQRQREIGGCRQQGGGALVGGQLAGEEHIRPAVRRPGLLRLGPDRHRVHRIRNGGNGRRLGFLQPIAQRLRNRLTDGDQGVRPGQRAPFPPQVGLHVRNERRGERPCRAGARAQAVAHPLGRATGTDGACRRIEHQVGPIAERPVVADGADGRDTRTACRRHAGRRAEGVLRVHQIDLVFTDHGVQPFGEPGPEPLVPEPVPHERNAGRRGGEGNRAEAVEFLLLCGRSASQPWPDDRQFVPMRAQAARQFVGAPAAAPADRGKDVGRNQQAHRIQARGRRSRAASIAAASRSQCRSQP